MFYRKKKNVGYLFEMFRVDVLKHYDNPVYEWESILVNIHFLKNESTTMRTSEFNHTLKRILGYDL